jgi:hypothetical protein
LRFACEDQQGYGIFGMASVIGASVHRLDVQPAVRALKLGSGPYG